MLYPHTIIVYKSRGRRDGDGNPIRWPGDEGIPVPAYMQLKDSSKDDVEAGDGGPSARTRVDAIAYISRFAGQLDPWCRITWDGAEFTPIGDPIDHRNLDGSVTFWKAELRRTGTVAPEEPEGGGYGVSA
ncbi:MAG: hypothetical protein ACRD0P_12765 [Stackebrandtia sp.]